MTELQIAFPKVDEGSKELVVPMEPSAPVSKGLATIVESGSPTRRSELSCSALLQGETRVKAELEAAELLSDMLDNPQIMMTYGLSALQDINALVDRLLHEVEPVKIPELTQLMKDLNDDMRGVQQDYDVSDPKVREKFENWGKGLRGLLQRGKTLIEMLMEDVTSIEKQIDRVGANLRGKQMILMENVGYYDELYKENEAAIKKLIYVIGIMELVRDLAVNQAEAIDVGNADLGDRGQEQKAQLAEFASNMNVKIAEYKGRLWVAWATSPQVRMLRTMNVGLAGRINEMVNVTIPTMRATIVVWRAMMQAQEAAETNDVVRGSANSWLQSFSSAAAVAVPMIAEEVQTPTITPETVYAMAKSIDEQATGIVTAMENGAKRRAELDKAMVTAKQVLDSSAQKISDALVDQVIDQAAKLDVATSVA